MRTTNFTLSSTHFTSTKDENKIYIFLPKTIFGRKRLSMPATHKEIHQNKLFSFFFLSFFLNIIFRWCFVGRGHRFHNVCIRIIYIRTYACLLHCKMQGEKKNLLLLLLLLIIIIFLQLWFHVLRIDQCDFFLTFSLLGSFFLSENDIWLVVCTALSFLGTSPLQE